MSTEDQKASVAGVAIARPSVAPRWRRRLLRAVFALACGYALVCGLLYLIQDRLIFPAVRFTADPPRRATNLEGVALTRDDGVVLRGLFRKPVQPRAVRRPTIIYFGGNAEEVTWWGTYAGWPADCNVVLVNYRGYGASSGKPSEAALYADAVALHDWVRVRADVDDERIVVFGRSLGSAVATYVARERPVRAVMLTAPIDRLADVARGVYPWVPVEWLLRHRFDSIARVPELRQPVLMLATPLDRVIPIEHSERLLTAWGGTDRTFVKIPDTDHSDIASDGRYWDAIRTFMIRVR